MLAAYHGNAETVQVLAKHDADVNRTNVRGQTPLASATHAFPDGAGQLTVSEPRTPRLPGPTASG